MKVQSVDGTFCAKTFNMANVKVEEDGTKQKRSHALVDAEYDSEEEELKPKIESILVFCLFPVKSLVNAFAFDTSFISSNHIQCSS